MEWWLMLLALLGGLIVLMLSGLPVAFSFMLLCVVGLFFLAGGRAGLEQLILGISSSLTKFSLVPIPLFILMGEMMFLSGVAPLMVRALDMWFGRIPGRLSLLAVGAGTVFGAVSGASMASVAMLGSTLLPEMEKRGYKKQMTLGPIIGSGGLDVMIPPSSLAVLLGAIAEISVGKLLIAIIVPGLIMAAFYALYIIGRCWLQPELAPSYDVPAVPVSEKLVAFGKHILPLGFIVFMVMGIMFVGVATPSEAAATGALSCFILAAAYRKLNWKVVKDSVTATLRVSAMLFLIIALATSFSQILAYSGASRGLTQFASSLALPPIVIIVGTQVVGLFLGMFMNPASIMMITLPIFMPVVRTLGFDPVWFGAIYLLNMEIGTMSPPFGTNLFVMKSVAPAGTTMEDIIRGSLPFVYMDLFVMAVMIAFPVTALWLVDMMH